MDINYKTKEILDEIILLRRYLHKHPELSNQEFQTSNIVSAKLKDIGLEVKTGIGKTGVIGILKGQYPGKTIALRADMDALPITEQTGLGFESINNGVMHACGHDMHTSILIGCAKVLFQFRDQIHGNVKFIFQPAEEKLDGARNMINDGVLDNPKVDAMLALHCWPDFKTGTIGIKKGAVLASGDFLDIHVKGKQGHAGYPHKAIDPITISGYIMTSLQTIVSRKVPPTEPATITIGKITGGTAFNVIPESVYMSGTVRVVNEELRNALPDIIKRNITYLAESMDGEAYVKYNFGSPSLINNDVLVNLFVQMNKNNSLGYKLVYMNDPTLGSEDFAYFSQKVPSLFFRLGTSEKDDSNNYPLHHPKVIFDEDSIFVGITSITQFTLNFLKK